LSALYASDLFKARALSQVEALKAGALFAETEGIIPAPESAYAIAASLQLAAESKANPAPCILMNISGHGLFDLSAYEQARRGELGNDTPDEGMIEASLAGTIERNAELTEANPSNVSA
jgi:tryptophan synthase beta chain